MKKNWKKRGEQGNQSIQKEGFPQKKFIDLFQVDNELNSLGYYSEKERIPGFEELSDAEQKSRIMRAKVNMVMGTSYVYKLKQDELSFA
ncbi:MAG: hypothetical protein GXP45_07560 [bacterium]|nr:hypothetical protein [bacterium]